MAAVVMTHNRRERVQRWLQCIRKQTRLPDVIIVVDNGSTDGTSDLVRREHPDVEIVRSEENTGSAGCGQLAVEAAFTRGFDWFFMFDDDAFPQEDALEKTLAAAQALRHRGVDVGMMWMPFSDLVGWRWNGTKTAVSLQANIDDAETPIRVDLIDMNMTLVRREMVEAIGYPRGDFFMMMWANEYCLRAKQKGFSIWTFPQVLCSHEHAGSTTCGEWRTYYQTRNHLKMVLERRCASEILQCAIRQCRFIAGILVGPGRKAHRLSLRFAGIRDAIRGVTGKTIEPSHD